MSKLVHEDVVRESIIRSHSAVEIEDSAAAVSATVYEHFDVIDLYHKRGMGLKQLVKYKRLKDPQTGSYKNYSYPAYIHVPFNPLTDEYPYPPDAMNITYDGLHPSDKGFTMIANLLIARMKKY